MTIHSQPGVYGFKDDNSLILHITAEIPFPRLQEDNPSLTCAPQPTDLLVKLFSQDPPKAKHSNSRTWGAKTKRSFIAIIMMDGKKN